ncbi:hypothetical protein BGW42_002484 [Actinomortierella wolfii]|nr:hypothetical protein BGW42_002484 [Actinomortierella wolfii]
MKFVSAAALLAMTLATVSADPTDAAKLSARAAIIDSFFKDCIPGTNQTIPLKSGATELSCRKKTNRSNGAKHHFSTQLYVRINENSIHVPSGGSAAGYVSTASGFTFVGYLASDWGAQRAVLYPERKTIDEVVNLGRDCSSDGVFCFDVIGQVCKFYYANRVWDASCPLLKVINISVDA